MGKANSLASSWPGSPGEQQLMGLGLRWETVAGREAHGLLRVPGCRGWRPGERRGQACHCPQPRAKNGHCPTCSGRSPGKDPRCTWGTGPQCLLLSHTCGSKPKGQRQEGRKRRKARHSALPGHLGINASADGTHMLNPGEFSATSPFHDAPGTSAQPLLTPAPETQIESQKSSDL